MQRKTWVVHIMSLLLLSIVCSAFMFVSNSGQPSSEVGDDNVLYATITETFLEKDYVCASYGSKDLSEVTLDVHPGTRLCYSNPNSEVASKVAETQFKISAQLNLDGSVNFKEVVNIPVHMENTHDGASSYANSMLMVSHIDSKQAVLVTLSVVAPSGGQGQGSITTDVSQNSRRLNLNYPLPMENGVIYTVTYYNLKLADVNGQTQLQVEFKERETVHVEGGKIDESEWGWENIPPEDWLFAVNTKWSELR